MTEAWKSNPMHWCDVCRCWLNDTKAARQHHEQGMGHKANLAKKLREMGKKADEEKRVKEATAASLARIEDQARKQYEADKAAAARASEAAYGKWVWDASCSYYYNEKHRWYYDPSSKWYYGGEPTPEWKQEPPLPAGALFGTAPHEGGPLAQQQPQGAATGSAAAQAGKPPGAKPGGSAAAAGTALAASTQQQAKQVVLQLPKHPLAGVGGHQGPTIGRVGAAKGVGNLSGTAAGSQPGGAATAGDKLCTCLPLQWYARKRDAAGGGDKALSKEELEARARREAARQRVAERTAKGFGYL